MTAAQDIHAELTTRKLNGTANSNQLPQLETQDHYLSRQNLEFQHHS